MSKNAKKSVKKAARGKLAGVTAGSIRARIRRKETVTAICASLNVSRKALYAKFGDEIKGLSPRGRRAVKK